MEDRPRLTGFLRYVLLPAVVLAAGVKLGLKYSADHYVTRDKKFIEGKVVNGQGKSARHS